MQAISSAWVGPVREVNCLMSTSIISLFVQLNGLAIVVGQERAADNRVIAEQQALLHPFIVPRAESSERSMAQVVA
jgi:hypothetical protein